MRSRLSAILSLSLKQSLFSGSNPKKWIVEAEGGCCEELMIAEIIKIHDPKQSVNGNVYRRVELKDNQGNWFKTDLCPDYRNWERWKKYLKVGNLLGNLVIKGPDTIDADSRPIMITGRRKEIELMPTEKIKKTINEELFGPGYQP